MNIRDHARHSETALKKIQGAIKKLKLAAPTLLPMLVTTFELRNNNVLLVDTVLTYPFNQII